MPSPTELATRLRVLSSRGEAIDEIVTAVMRASKFGKFYTAHAAAELGVTKQTLKRMLQRDKMLSHAVAARLAQKDQTGD